jgi:hypothetical protein
VQNTYEIKINNKTERVIPFEVEVVDLDDAELDFGQLARLHLQPEQSLRLLARVRLSPDLRQKGPQAFEFVVRPGADSGLPELRQSAFFYFSGAR